MATLADHKYVWDADYSIKALLVGAVVFLIGLWDPFRDWNVDAIIGFLLGPFFLLGLFGNIAFGAADVLIYKWTGYWGNQLHAYLAGNPTAKEHHIRGIAAYRWPQHIVFFVVAIMLAKFVDFKVGFGMVLLWWTGLTDWIYYILSKSEFGETYNWLTGWIWIFPAGAIWKLVGKPMPKWAFFSNVILGVIAWVLLGVL